MEAQQKNDQSGRDPGTSRTRRDPSHSGRGVHGPSSLEAIRNGQRVLDMAPSLSKLDVRTYGWQEAEISKNDTLLTGYVKMAKGTEQAELNPDSFSGKALITAERLKSDPAF